MRTPLCALLCLALVALMPPAAQAQSDAPVGVRAAGMGGAFVAVADDASAVYWNPAGLASGSYVSMVIDRNQMKTADDVGFPREGSGLLVALGTPALGVTYYRTTLTRRVAVGSSTPQVENLVTHHLGATLVQSIGDVLAVGATLKYVRGVAAAIEDPHGLGLDQIDDVDERGSNKFDADLGVMATHGGFKAGLSVRNLFEPSFETVGGGNAIALQRRVRAGVSYQISQVLRLAGDSDLTRADVSDGRWRDAAVGAEARFQAGPALRAGFHWNTAGGSSTTAPVGSVGVSYPVYRSMLADAQVSFGSRNGDRGWGVGARVLF